MNLQPGTIVDGRYEILEHIGCGGMGDVYRARELGLDRDIAIKMIHSSLVADQENRDRFKQECKILSTLEHPNILMFYRFGLWERQFPYMAVELLDGTSLLTLLIKGALPVSRVISIAQQICQGMEYAHDRGIVHRDLKPGNVFLTASPRGDIVKILDFGLARIVPLAEDSGQHLTQTGCIVGSLYYMSPEQCEGKKADARSDIYSLGCLLYELLTGVPPLMAETAVGLMYKHVNEMPAPLPAMLGQERPPDGLQNVLFRALAKHPGDRYSSMANLNADLDLVIHNRGGEIAACRNGVVKPRKGLSVLTLVSMLLLLIPAGFCFFVASIGNGAANVAITPTRHSNKMLPRKLPSDERLGGFGGNKTAALTEWLTRYGASDLEGSVRARGYLLKELRAAGAPVAQLDLQYRLACEAFAKLLAGVEHGSPMDQETYEKVIETHIFTVRNWSGPEETKELIGQILRGRTAKLLPPHAAGSLARLCGDMLYEEGDFESEEKWRRISTQTRDPEDFARLSRCLARLGKKVEAKTALDDSLANLYQSISASAVHKVAQVLIGQHRAAEALEVCELCKVDYDRSICISGQGESKESRLGCSPQWPHHLIVWDALRSQGKKKQAKEYLFTAFQTATPGDRWLLLSGLVYEEGEHLSPDIEKLVTVQLASPAPDWLTEQALVRMAMLLTGRNRDFALKLANKCHDEFFSQRANNTMTMIEQQLLLSRAISTAGNYAKGLEICEQLMQSLPHIRLESRPVCEALIKAEIVCDLNYLRRHGEVLAIVQPVIVEGETSKVPVRIVARLCISAVEALSTEKKFSDAYKLLDRCLVMASKEKGNQEAIACLWMTYGNICDLDGDHHRGALLKKQAKAIAPGMFALAHRAEEPTCPLPWD